jgi:hypothetical protein
MKPITAEEKVAFLEERHALILKSLHKRLDELEQTKQKTPHPLDFSMNDDPNAYQNACSGVQWHNFEVDKAITTQENFIRFLETLDRELEAKLNPTNEYEI